MRAALCGLLLCSCSFRDLDYLSDRPSSTDTGVPSDAIADVATDASTCPPRMVRVDSFCIDATEVIERDYTAFLDAKKGDTSGQIAACSANASYQPDPTLFPKVPTGPVRGVDWCDAYAYCAWAGKRLCGKIGGGSVPILSTDDPEVDQWYRACSRAGARAFPYGDTYDPTACRTKNSGSVIGGSMTKCEGGYPGIFDMSGNVWEWEDACDDAGECVMRGGGWPQEGIAAGCAYGVVHYNAPRTESSGDRGIRCCTP
jgi:formylglycine-generating enzyme